MNWRIAAVVVLGIAGLILRAEPQVHPIEVPLQKHALISASAVDDEGRGWLAVATPEPWRTDVYRVSPGGLTHRATIRDAVVKRIQQLAGRERYFIHGAQSDPNGGSSVFYRVVAIGDEGISTLWDSGRLPASLRTEEHLVAVSDDAAEWASASIEDRNLRVTFGSTSADKPRTTISIESSPIALPQGFEYDGAGLEFIGRSGGKTLVAALWRGRVFVMDGERIVAQTVPPNGGASLAYDPASSTLWVITSRSVAGFDARDLTKPAKVTMLTSNHGRATQVFPLAGGRLAVASVDQGLLVTDIEDANGKRVRRSFSRSGANGTLAVSRGGKSVLEMPQASESRTVFLHMN